MIKPLICIKAKSKESEDHPIMIVAWLDAEESQGELLIALNKRGGVRGAENFLSYLLSLLLFSDTIDVRRGGMSSLQAVISGFLAVTSSTAYPYTYIFSTLPGSEEGTDEQRARILTTFHRVSKLPLGVTRIGEPAISIDVKGSDLVALAAAVAIASMAAGRGRRGYTLSLTLAQSLLPILIKAEHEHEQKSIINLLAATVAYIYTYYRHRIIADEGELIRYFMAKPPCTVKAWEDLHRELQEVYTRILIQQGANKLTDLKAFTNILNGMSKETLKAAASCNRSDPLFGRASILASKILEKLQIAGREGSNDVMLYDKIVTIATEQWGPLQHYIMSLALSDKGELNVLYTQEIIHNIILERYISEKLNIMQSPNRYKVEYVPISATDSYAVQKTIESLFARINADTRVLVLAQGPSTIALPLYARAKRISNADAILV